jgi:hypothetical protein
MYVNIKQVQICPILLPKSLEKAWHSKILADGSQTQYSCAAVHIRNVRAKSGHKLEMEE